MQGGRSPLALPTWGPLMTSYHPGGLRSPGEALSGAGQVSFVALGYWGWDAGPAAAGLGAHPRQDCSHCPLWGQGKKNSGWPCPSSADFSLTQLWEEATPSFLPAFRSLPQRPLPAWECASFHPGYGGSLVLGVRLHVRQQLSETKEGGLGTTVTHPPGRQWHQHPRCHPPPPLLALLPPGSWLLGPTSAAVLSC